jgi:hypothetical protein
VSDLDQPSVTITGLSHDVTKKSSSVSVMWGDNPEMRMGLPVPYGCALEDLRVETEKAMRELSTIAAKIAVNMPK